MKTKMYILIRFYSTVVSEGMVLTKDARKRAKSSSISIFAHIVLFPSCLKRIVAFHFYVRGTTGWYKINEWLEEILLFSCFYDHLFSSLLPKFMTFFSGMLSATGIPRLVRFQLVRSPA